MGRHSAERRRVLPWVVGALVALAIVAGVVRAVASSSPATAPVGAAASPTSSAATPSPTSSAPSPTSSPTQSADEVAAREALQQCVRRQDAAQPVVAAAATGAAHWREHVQGQADIDSGAKSLIAVKTGVWAATTAAGPNDAATFLQAASDYAKASGCTDVAAVADRPGLPGELSGALRACATRQGAVDAYVKSATAVMGDWKSHVEEMQAHREGAVNSVQAQANWLTRYRAAPTHLVPFQQAQDALAKAPACTA